MPHLLIHRMLRVNIANLRLFSLKTGIRLSLQEFTFVRRSISDESFYDGPNSVFKLFNISK